MSNQETGVGGEWKLFYKALAKAEQELEVERWVIIGLVAKDGNREVELHKYDIPVEKKERYEWIIRWRQAKLQCERPRQCVGRYYYYYYRRHGVCLGWKKDIDQLVGCKAKLTRAKKCAQEYIEAHTGELFFDPNTDEELVKYQAKIQKAETDIKAAEQRMMDKLKEYEQQSKKTIN